MSAQPLANVAATSNVHTHDRLVFTFGLLVRLAGTWQATCRSRVTAQNVAGGRSGYAEASVPTELRDCSRQAWPMGNRLRGRLASESRSMRPMHEFSRRMTAEFGAHLVGAAQVTRLRGLPCSLDARFWSPSLLLLASSRARWSLRRRARGLCRRPRKPMSRRLHHRRRRHRLRRCSAA